MLTAAHTPSNEPVVGDHDLRTRGASDVATGWLEVRPGVLAAFGAPGGCHLPWIRGRALAFRDNGLIEASTITISSWSRGGEQLPRVSDCEIWLLVDEEAWTTFLTGRSRGGPEIYHFPAELRLILGALRSCDRRNPIGALYVSAKAAELLCETVRLLRSRLLVPAIESKRLSHADVAKLLLAREIVEERATQNLNLDAVARACGLNRAKLTSGFRVLFGSTVGDAIAERRFSIAQRMLLTTDVRINTIAYEIGYLNNASFARAFKRHVGMSAIAYRNVGWSNRADMSC